MCGTETGVGAGFLGFGVGLLLMNPIAEVAVGQFLEIGVVELVVVNQGGETVFATVPDVPEEGAFMEQGAVLLKELIAMGFAGIQNFPTVGLIDGQFRANLEETGMGFDLEIECIRAAHDLDMLTTPYAFDLDQARELTAAGADIVVAHMGLTTSGSIGAQTAKTLDQAVEATRAMVDAAKSQRDDVPLLCHRGPLAMPDDAQYVFDRVDGIDGFYGASSMERLPTEIALTAQVREFTDLRLSTA